MSGSFYYSTNHPAYIQALLFFRLPSQQFQHHGNGTIGCGGHRQQPIQHPSGKKMHDFADVVIDNKVEKGDAMLSMDGLNTKFTPASGITSAAIMHCLTTATIEKLLQKGITPPVFIAANVDGGAEHNQKLMAEYRDRIFYI